MKETEYQPFPVLAYRNALQQRFEVPTLVRLLSVPVAGRVLEVGCGVGNALPALARLLEPSRLVGLDIEKTLLAQSARTLGAAGVEAELVHGDVRDLPFADASFDVVDFGTCYHVAHPEQALEEVERVLAPGGLFVYETPVGQLIAHPVRTRGRRLPWRGAPSLVDRRTAGLWSARTRCAA